MICSFCKDNILSPYPFKGQVSELRPHHASAESWVKSLWTRCTICWTLWQEACGAPAPANVETLASQYQNQEVLVELIAREVDCWPKYETCMQAYGPSYWIGTVQYTVKDGQRQKDRGQLDAFVLHRVNGEQDSNVSLRGSKTEPSSELDDGPLEAAARWLQNCKDHHEDCRALNEKQTARWISKGSDNFLPSRLLQVGSNDSRADSLRLIITCEEKIKGPYMTLSHRWGDPRQYVPLRLLKSTLDQFRHTIDHSSLPKTFREARDVCRAVGIHYLWIDSLCIVQDDADDWLREAATMQLCYQHSYCNIAAGNSSDARGGLLPGPRPDVLRPEVVNFKGDTFRITTNNLWEGEVANSPLNHRAWVLQERMMSPRILHFSPEQAFWQCPSLTACEGAPHGLPEATWSPESIAISNQFSGVVTKIPFDGSPLRDPGLELSWRRALHTGLLNRDAEGPRLHGAALYEMWRLVVKSYSACGLTHDTDKLVALSGVASAMLRAIGTQYIAGLWLSDHNRVIPSTVDQLGWRVGRPPVSSNKTAGTRYRQYCGPSWSWTSVEGIINLVDDRVPPVEHRFLQANGLGGIYNVVDKNWPTGPLQPDCVTEIEGHILLVARNEFDTNGYRKDNKSDMSWSVKFDDEEDDPFMLSPTESGEITKESTRLTVLLLGLTYTIYRKSLRWKVVENESVSPVDTDEPLETDGTPKDKRLQGRGLILKPVESRTGYFERIGLLVIDEIREERLQKLEELMIRDPKEIGSEEYDASKGHKINLI